MIEIRVQLITGTQLPPCPYPNNGPDSSPYNSFLLAFSTQVLSVYWTTCSVFFGIFFYSNNSMANK
jgi:hypothetical protein